LSQVQSHPAIAFYEAPAITKPSHSISSLPKTQKCLPEIKFICVFQLQGIQFNSIRSSWMPKCKHIQNFQESFKILWQNFEESKSVIILPFVYDQPYAALAPSTEFSMLYVEKDIKINTTKKYLFACSSLTPPILSTSLQILLNIMMPPHQIPLS
jgi:hypothetical protein